MKQGKITRVKPHISLVPLTGIKGNPSTILNPTYHHKNLDQPLDFFVFGFKFKKTPVSSFTTQISVEDSKEKQRIIYLVAKITG